MSLHRTEQARQEVSLHRAEQTRQEVSLHRTEQARRGTGEMDRRCPDCGVTTESVTFRTN
ncbi:hypothetical protein DM867_12255 [Halosegnis rubeus]|uniref:Uncharacterized protein n=1 Tax=Halosegnis rubeus TaxID=2212850 RepID=A0A5N5U2A8_9EURY|nr:hypothetical protein [Halosegnis rubeus]KAB7512686.1 hypothetical protein DM867_12255 [Halosegnis rubeus]KAB7515488.1 hypothetical protein DP108_11000 [Halosegnis rubeus]KAB7518611.1 hypothetical protein DMP03_04455 [Halosegnis rubeus]